MTVESAEKARRGLPASPLGRMRTPAMSAPSERPAPAGTPGEAPATEEGTRPLGLLRNAVVVAIGLVVVMALFLAAYSGAFSDPVPHAIPVAVLAPAPLASQLATTPALRVRPADNASQVRELVEARSVYGGLIAFDRRNVELIVASGGGHSVAAALRTVVTAAAQRSGARLTVEDLAPLNGRDPTGAVEFYSIVFLTLASSLGAMVLGRVMGRVRHHVDAWGRAVFLALYAGLLAAVFGALADSGLGALVGHPAFLFLVFWACSVAVCLAISGVSALLGGRLAIVVIVATVMLGNTSSGGPVGRPLLSTLYSSLTPIFPQGAGLTMVRGANYFASHGVASGGTTLAVWGGVGLVLLIGAGLRNQWRAKSLPPPPATVGTTVRP